MDRLPLTLLAIVAFAQPFLPDGQPAFAQAGQTPPAAARDGEGAGADTDAHADADASQPRRGLTVADLKARDLSLVPIEVESLGLTFHPPADADSQIHRVGGQTRIHLLGTDPIWQMQVAVRASTLADPSASAQVNAMLQSLRAADRSLEVIVNEPVSYSGAEGQLCYVREQPSGAGGSGGANGAGEQAADAIVRGYLMLRLGPTEFLVFAMETAEHDFAHVRLLLEGCFQTIRLRDVEQIVARRRADLEAGAAFLKTLTAERLQSLVGTREVYRYYLPAASAATDADTEIGWYLLEVREAKRGAVIPRRAEENYDAIEQEVGLLVYVYGRYVDGASRVDVSSEAHYWVAWDLSTETWSIIVTQRQANKERSEAVTGTLRRSNTGTGTLHVISSMAAGAGSDDRAPGRQEKQWHVPEVYLPQALRWLLPMLLVQDGPGTRHYYCVDTVNELNLSLRVDELERSGDGSGNWVLTGQNRIDLPAEVSILSPQGKLLRKSWPEGAVAEPLKPEQLRRIWQGKGLDTGRIPR